MLVDLLTAVFLILFGFALRGWAQSRREDRLILSHIEALGMEIHLCGQLAATYLHADIDAPLYRLPNDAYRIALLSLSDIGLIYGDHWYTLQRFYLQVEQVNRGLDNVDDFLRGKTPENDGQGITLEDEKKRLNGKAGDLRAAGHGEDASDLYREAVAAHKSIVNLWFKRSWWRQFKRKHVRPNQERLKQLWQRLPWRR